MIKCQVLFYLYRIRDPQGLSLFQVNCGANNNKNIYKFSPLHRARMIKKLILALSVNTKTSINFVHFLLTHKAYIAFANTGPLIYMLIKLSNDDKDKMSSIIRFEQNSIRYTGPERFKN